MNRELQNAPNVIQLRCVNEAWPMGAKMLLVVAQANEANNATDETPVKGAPLRALRLAFVCEQFYDNGLSSLGLQEFFICKSVHKLKRQFS